MIAVKIQCACGQRYAFDVDPVDGHMPGAVACPACGADGTRAAEEIIQGSLIAMPPPPKPAAKPTVRIRVPSAPPAAEAAPSAGTGASFHTTMARRALTPHLGQVDREQVGVQARAKVFWGDDRDEIIKYLMMNGYDVHEAKALVHEMRKERAATIRGKGIKKALIGVGMMCIPILYLGASLVIGFISIWLIGVTGAAGLWGAWNVLDGLMMFFSPGSEGGDVADK